MSLLRRDENALSKLQKLRFFPLAITGGSGCYLIDEEGRRLLDFSASWGAASLGNGHPALRRAINEVMGSPAGASILSAVNQPAIELAEALIPLVSGAKDARVWIGHAGSDANEAVLRAVMAATGKKRIISFVGAYHGCTTGSMAISGHTVQQDAEKAEGLLLLPYPDPYRPVDGDHSGQNIIERLKHHFATDCPPQEVAALFFEPILSDGGLIVPPEGFMKRLEALCKEHGIYMVADEVKVGSGRTGEFSCHIHDNIEPDFVVFGKGLGGGLPLSAVVGPATVMNHASAFAMQTLHGNPVSASAGLAVLQTLHREKLLENAVDVGGYLLERLQDLKQKHFLIGDVRGRGLALGVELVRDRSTKEPADIEAAKLVFRSFELGLVLYYVGLSGNVLELTPPLTLSRAQADEGVDILDQAISDVLAGVVSDEQVAAYKGWGG
ncbi:MAG: aspartate aminotransferase family protein [Desulfohalobiaceae bacterium]|nr:aspartate aminotransferase family protein [Desulfohalobiaceae bacterium]